MLYSILLIGNVCSSTSLSLITPFFPPAAKDKGISEDIIGIIFAVDAVAGFIAALILGKVLTKVL